VRETTTETDAAFARRFAAVPAIDRLRMTCEMFDSAKRLVASGIRAGDPGISDADLQVRIFQRLYSTDFDEATLQRLVAALRP
jgi:hypothetical protein